MLKLKFLVKMGFMDNPLSVVKFIVTFSFCGYSAGKAVGTFNTNANGNTKAAINLGYGGNVNNVIDSDMKEFYPVADDDLRQGGDGRGSTKNDIPNKSRDEETLMNAVKKILRNMGYHSPGLQIILLPNSSLILDDQSAGATPGTKEMSIKTEIKTKSKTKVNANVNTDVNTNVNPAPDEYSINSYKKKIKVILEKDRKNEQLVAEELKNLLRGLKGNRTLLIAMIQAAAQQWGVEEYDLPPPFGTRISTAPFNVPTELREELIDLSDLLTADLKSKLIELLSSHHNKSKEEIRNEMATIEESETGETKLLVNNKDVALETSAKLKRNSLDGTYSNVVVQNHKESGNDDDFTIAEELIFDEVNKVKREEPTDISSANLENIIRQDQRLKSLEQFKRGAGNPKHVSSEEEVRSQLKSKSDLQLSSKSFSRQKRV